MARPSGRPIRDELIEVATAMIRRVGVSGFSYADLARELEIKAPSIHHHFKAKEDLIAAVAGHYRQHFADQVAAIDAPTAVDRLRAYAAMFATSGDDANLCLCGAVSAEWRNVGAASRIEVDGFFSDQRAWLRSEIERGVGCGELSSDLTPVDVADTILAALEGSMLISRASGETDLAERVGAVITGMVAR